MRNYKSTLATALAVATLISAPVFAVIVDSSTTTPSSKDQKIEQESRTFKSTDKKVNSDVNKEVKPEKDVFKKEVKVEKSAPGFKSDSVKTDHLNRNANESLNDSSPF